MQIQNKNTPTNIIVMITMVFCIVFASSLKAAIDSIDITKKTTSQQLLEEEPNEKESKIEKELFSKYNSFYDSIDENYTYTPSEFIFHSILKITLPYLKVHTPPPDFFIVFS